MGKTSDDLSALNLLWRRTFLCMLDHSRKVFLFTFCSRNMFTSRISHSSCRIDPVFVAVLWRNNTVCSHHDRTMKTLKLFFLFPPCISIISCKIRIFFECRIVMCRKHLWMCIDIHTCPLRLFQQHFQITEIVSWNQDSRIVSNPDIYFCDLRISISLCICLIKKCHHLYTIFSGFQRQGCQFFRTESIIQCCGKCSLKKSIQFFLIMKKCKCMLLISGKPF